jgi:BRCT domain type II-containing protein
MAMSRRIYVTGKIKGLTKQDLKAFAKQHGLEYGPFSGKTEILILGERPGNKKIQRAQNEGIETLSWDNFLEKFNLKSPFEEFLKKKRDS